MYRVGFPGWKLAARMGVPVLIRLHVVKDDEAGVLIATSPDLRGLVAEAKTVEDLMNSVRDCTDMLIEAAIHGPLKSKPLAAWSGEILAA